MTLKQVYNAWAERFASRDDESITAEEFDDFAREHTTYYDLCCGRGWEQEESKD